MTCLRVALLLLLLTGLPIVVTAGTVSSQQHNVPYTATVDVDSTAVEIVIDFDGNGLADSSRLLSVVHITGDGAYCVERGTATATGAALTTGQVWTFNRRDGGQPVSRLSCITAATEGATVAIWADR